MNDLESFTENESALLDAVPDALASGVDLFKWWRRTDAEMGYEVHYEETAAVVGRTVGTVRARLHYAKKALHETLTRGLRGKPIERKPS